MSTEPEPGGVPVPFAYNPPPPYPAEAQALELTTAWVREAIAAHSSYTGRIHTELGDNDDGDLLRYGLHHAGMALSGAEAEQVVYTIYSLAILLEWTELGGLPPALARFAYAVEQAARRDLFRDADMRALMTRLRAAENQASNHTSDPDAEARKPRATSCGC
jgi:hypothetical protein